MSCVLYAGIGEVLRQQCVDLAEDKRQRTIRSVEEVIRREEGAKANKKLSEAKSVWLEERKTLFQDAHQSQLRAIARQSSILETQLRKEFADTLEHLAQEHEETLAREIEKTWTEAEAIKRDTVEGAKQVERAIARANAREQAEKFAETIRQNNQRAEKDKQNALSEQMEILKLEECRALKRQRAELEGEFEKKLSSVCEESRCKLEEVGRELTEQQRIVEELEIKLTTMTQLKDNWETKYDNIRTEFSHFIDLVPGFRGEFVLK